MTDPNNNIEVANTKVLDAECEATDEVALGISILANKCTHVLQSTYRFNAIVQPDHVYDIETELRSDGHIGCLCINLIGCKYRLQWDSVGSPCFAAPGALGHPL